MLKSLIVICFLLFFAGVIVALAQMWFGLLPADTFIKVLITDAALFAVVFVMAFLVREGRAAKKINDGDL